MKQVETNNFLQVFVSNQLNDWDQVSITNLSPNESFPINVQASLVPKLYHLIMSCCDPTSTCWPYTTGLHDILMRLKGC